MNRPQRSFPRRQRGFTLVELLVALVLGALVVLAATAMVVTSRATYRTQDEATRVQETSRFGLTLVNRMVRLAGYTDFGDSTSPPPAYSYAGPPTDVFAPNGPNIIGADHTKPTSGPGFNNSDSLVIRYYGTGGTAGVSDNNVLDCAGVGVPAPFAPATADRAAANAYSRAYNVLFVDADPDGEPALKCERKTFDTTGAVLTDDIQTLLRGVESFQILYGEENFATADIDFTPPTGLVYRTGVGGVNPVINWPNIKTVRIAMLIRSNVGAQTDTSTQTYNLFGAAYPNGTTDLGTQFSTSTLSIPERTRLRRVVETTIYVRNRVSQWPGLN